MELHDKCYGTSEEYICGKTELNYDIAQTSPKITDCKTEECTNIGEVSTVSDVVLEREEKVGKLNIEFVVL